MLKERLYYKEPNCQSFTTKITKTKQDESGQNYVVLAQTAFYPTGGGQPHDLGTIHGEKVINVEEVDDEIRHYIDKPIHSLDKVSCLLDWKRRFDHMQQHTGQHILSAAFAELFDLPTVSFHLGKSLVSIDLDTEHISAEQLNAVEQLANEIILENRPIDVKWVTENDLDAYPLRKKVQAEGEIRLVIIPNFDYNGCGGTHTESTGQVNAIKIMSTEKHRGQTRVHFICGKRVLSQLHHKTTIVREASQLLSASEEQIGEAIAQLLATKQSLEKSVQEAEEAILQFEAKELIGTQDSLFIRSTFENRSIQQLQKLARLVVADAEEAIVLLVAKNEGKLQFVAARGKLVELSMKTISASVLPTINGKGGGSDAFVQGGGDSLISAEALVQKMIESL